MRQEFFNLNLSTDGQRLYEFTNQTNKWINDNENEKRTQTTKIIKFIIKLKL